MWKYHILHIETKLEFQAEDKVKHKPSNSGGFCVNQVKMSTTSRCYLNQRTIQLLMGVTGRIGGQTRQGQDQFVEILFVVSSEAEYQDYLYVLAGRREEGAD